MDFATGRTAFSLASGEMMRPALSLFFLMYTQIAFVTLPRRSSAGYGILSMREPATRRKPYHHTHEDVRKLK